MEKIDPVLQMEDIAEIFRVSIPTVNRWLRDAKQGKNDFPLPITTPGRKLTWSRKSVEDYLSEISQNGNIPQVESATKQRKRHDAALNDLESNHGITVMSQAGRPND